MTKVLLMLLVYGIPITLALATAVAVYYAATIAMVVLVTGGKG